MKECDVEKHIKRADNIKRILALSVVVVLVLIVLITFGIAIFGKNINTNIFFGFVACMIFCPVIVYVFLMFYKIFNKSVNEESISDDKK